MNTETIATVDPSGGLWIAVLLGSVFGLMIVAAVLVSLTAERSDGRRDCFGSDPDPLRQAYRQCNECEERGGCLK